MKNFKEFLENLDNMDKISDHLNLMIEKNKKKSEKVKNNPPDNSSLINPEPVIDTGAEKSNLIVFDG